MEKKGNPETKSQAAQSAKNSNRSSVSLQAAKARARAEAERARAHYAKKELEVRMEQVRMEGTLIALKHEKEAAAAMAEALVFQEAAESIGEGAFSARQSLAPAEDPIERTKDFVERHSNATPPGNQSHDAENQNEPPVDRNSLIDETEELPQSTPYRDLPPPRSDVRRPHISSKQVPEHVRSSHNPWTDSPSEFKPLPQYLASPLPHQPLGGEEAMSDIARFLARRDLIHAGLTKFDDRPENYWAWKSSFDNAKQGLYLTASEELNLLTKWLGPTSSEYVKRIRSVHIRYPDIGLKTSWDRLEEVYGAPEVIEKALLDRIESFPRITKHDPLKLRELGDLLREVLSAKTEGFLAGLSYLDTARGVNPIVEKLLYPLQEKWINQGSQYKRKHHASFPPFTFFTDFVCTEARARNDPSFNFSSGMSQVKADIGFKKQPQRKIAIAAHKTEVASTAESPPDGSPSDTPVDPGKHCLLHKNKPHPLRRCRGFRAKPLEERKAFLKDNGVCYRCCSSTTHLAKDCKVVVKCNECESDKHTSALHPGPPRWQQENAAGEHGGEENTQPTPEVSVSCTEICGTGMAARSCSKICLVKIFPCGHQEDAVKMYVVLDEQSNRSLAKSEFFDLFKIKSEGHPYTLRTCAGITETAGRRAMGFQALSLDGKTKVLLPTLIECNYIPDDRSEIPSPEIAHHFAHLKPIAHEIPAIDPEAKILLLLGRDVLCAHKVREQRNGPYNAPYAHRLDFGWVIVGNVCLGSAHKPAVIDVFRTSILMNGRPSLCTPCPNQIKVTERFTAKINSVSPQSTQRLCQSASTECNFGGGIFERTQQDDRIAFSMEDRMFIELMDKEVDSSNSWVAPLPFHPSRQRLPNNREQALQRFRSLSRTLERKPQMRDHFITFMQKIFDQNHAELAPPVKENEEVWYLPMFGVYHPRKPDQIRVVFDSSAQHRGISLNQVLLTGPDLNNSLLGVLIRFRQEAVAVTADVEQMFHSFLVREDHRNFLRFLWHADNDLSKPMVEYRMRVHVFGNSPSPAVAIYGLHRTAQCGESEFGKDAKDFVDHNFYVDDGLKSLPTAGKAVDLLRRTQDMLATFNLRLHKIASNNSTVMDAFPTTDHAKNLKDLDLEEDTPMIQRSLGLSWDLANDTFTYRIAAEDKPYTRRGVLSTVNSIFDPLGIIAPVTVYGKFLLRELTAGSADWDAELPMERAAEWMAWKSSLQDLMDFEIPRTYCSVSLTSAQRLEVHVFSDASTMAIAAVAYLKVVDCHGTCHVSFILGKAKLAPLAAHTVPRLELGAAVLAVELSEFIVSEMGITLHALEFYTDSRVVLGYIHNQKRRFYVYVSNRVQRIRKSTTPEQWHYVPTCLNPADHATRSLHVSDLKESMWLTGPAFLKKPTGEPPADTETFDLVDPDTDVEVRPNCTVLRTQTEEPHLGSQRFEKFSTWKSVTRTIGLLIHIVDTFKVPSDQRGECHGWHYCTKTQTPEHLSRARMVIIKAIQQDAYKDEIQNLSAGREVSCASSLRKLNPTLDPDDLLRVGGRLKHASTEYDERHPIIIPGKSHVAILLVRHFHERVKHQGRLFTEGSIRSAGYWIVGAKRCINKVIHKCVICQKLRGRALDQKMADLPADRLSMEPPFTYIGLDVFGPWMVITRKTRGGSANSKRWAVIFTCLSIRAVHFELIETLDSSSFINALRRFFALRGPAKLIRSDCGTNFVGACRELKMLSEEESVKGFLTDEGCQWIFNPPHASHMGGAWERLIGVARRILDSMLLQSPSQLTHEALSTFIAEVSAIMNARPIAPISNDPDSPALLSPAMLLTQKAGGLPPPPGTFDNNPSRQRWKQVQHLANTFWERWRKEYLATLQDRRKWQVSKPNIKEGDVILLKDSQVKRNQWPVGLVTKAFPSNDGRVRKVELRVVTQGIVKTFSRPISQVILLMSSDT